MSSRLQPSSARPSADARAVATALAGRRQAVGLLVLAGVILLAVLLRAPAHILFPSGWWRF